MNPFDRRTFLATGVRTSAAVAVAGVLPGFENAAAAATPQGVARASSSAPGLVAQDLTVNGTADPIGVDPDACSFAWVLRSPARGARQQGYRITVHRSDPLHTALVWDSGQVASARQAFVPYGGPALTANAAYAWTVEVQDDAGHWSAPAPSGSFVTTLRMADWTAKWLQPQAASQQPDVVTYVRTVVTPPRGSLAEGDCVHFGRPHLSALRRRQSGGLRAQLLVSRRAVRPIGRSDWADPHGKGDRTRCAASVVWRWSGSPALGSRSHRRALTDLHRWSAGGVRDGRHVERASGGMAALPLAQFRWSRLR